MKKNVILYVEDDRRWAEMEIANFQDNGFIVEWAQNREDALRLYREKAPDIIILDLMLVSADDGHWILKTIRSMDQQIPILLNTNRKDKTTAVKYLQAGGDDFIRKGDTDKDEIIAKISRLIQRSSVNQERKLKSTLTSDTSVDWARNTLTCCGHTENLPPRETHVLQLLSMSLNTLIGREIIESQVFATGKSSENYLNKSITYLRTKLEKDKKIEILSKRKNGIGLFISDL